MAIKTINENDYIKDSRADINDNFTELDQGKLSLSGGTMTGTITAPRDFVLRNVDDDYLTLMGGSELTKGAYIGLSGKDRSGGAGGQFALHANDGTNHVVLQGKPDGTLKWDNNNIITAAGGTMTGNIAFDKTDPLIIGNLTTTKIGLYAGANNFDGANLQLFGRNDSNYAGNFYLRASTKSSSSDTSKPSSTLVGKPDGTFQWNGDNILTDATVGTVASNSPSSAVSLSANTAKTITSKSLAKGTWLVIGKAYYSSCTADRVYGLKVGVTANDFAYGNDGSVAVHAAYAGNLALQAMVIVELTATTTMYLCGFSNNAATVSAAKLMAVRIV